LKWLQVTILGDRDARTQPSGLPITFPPDLMVAAAAPSGSGPWGGDSGRPLFHENYARETGTIIGIYSYGQCGDTLSGNLPDMYTEVNNPTIRKFITNAMR
jgi:secreted trypsin-like serine protease